MRGTLRSTWAHTWGFFWPSNKKAFGAFVVSMAIGIPLHVRFEGLEAAMGEGLILLIYGVAPLGMFTIKGGIPLRQYPICSILGL